MTVAVIGTGHIGRTLGRAFGQGGLDVVLGSRNPAATSETNIKVADITEALNEASTVVLAIPGTAVADFLSEYAASLDGKLIVDATNRFPGEILNSAAAVAEAVPSARYARAFNSLAWESFAEPTYQGEQGDLLFSASENDRPAVEELIHAVGLRPRYLGSDQQDLLDKGLMLIFPFFQTHGRHVGIRILTDDD